MLKIVYILFIKNLSTGRLFLIINKWLKNQYINKKLIKLSTFLTACELFNQHVNKFV